MKLYSEVTWFLAGPARPWDGGDIFVQLLRDGKLYERSVLFYYGAYNTGAHNLKEMAEAFRFRAKAERLGAEKVEEKFVCRTDAETGHDPEFGAWRLYP